MISKIKELGKDALIKGSFILIVLIVLSNILNYVFQILMARSLGPSDYSVLAVLMSIIYIFTIPNEAIQTAITKYTSLFNSQGKKGKIKDLLIRGLKKGLLFGLIFFLAYVLLSLFLASFLNISIWLILITGLFIFLVFTIPVTRGIMQGKKQFAQLGLNLVLESFLKVLLSIILVWVGFKVYGALGAVIAASAIALLISLLPIRDILSSKREREEFSDIYKTNMPLLIAMLSIVFMYSIDIILARRFFTPQIAGEYAFVSLIGKVIIFVSASVGKALFPLSSEEHLKGNRTHGLLKRGILIVSLMSVISLLIYLLIPGLVIYVLSLGSSQYLAASSVLFILGLAYSLISIANIIVLYKLSINKMKNSAYLLLLFALIEVVLLSIFNATLFQFSLALLASSVIMFLYSLWLLESRK